MVGRLGDRQWEGDFCGVGGGERDLDGKGWDGIGDGDGGVELGGSWELNRGGGK
jgi:hypothetical protein